jgi:hypothetical protein
LFSVLIIADHIMLTNPTDAQVMVYISFTIDYKEKNFLFYKNMSRPSVPTAQPTPSQTIENQNGSSTNVDIQNQMVLKFSQQSGMNIDYSKL